MWRVEALSAVPVALDFSSSTGRAHASTAIQAGSVRLINALDLIEFDPEATQVHVCNHCGSAGCQSGGWVTLRRLGEGVVWVPALERMKNGDEFARERYSPPAFMASAGAPYFLPGAWRQLRLWHAKVPAVSELRPASVREVLRALQWAAPCHCLGIYPAPPELRREGIVTVTNGELDAEIRAVNGALAPSADRDSPIQVLLATARLEPIEFWIDLPGIPAWRVFGRVGAEVVVAVDQMSLRIGGDAA